MPDKIIGEIPASGLIFKDIVKVPHPSRALLGLSLVLSLVLSLDLSLGRLCLGLSLGPRLQHAE